MKNKKRMDQTSFLLFITIVLFFVMYAMGLSLIHIWSRIRRTGGGRS